MVIDVRSAGTESTECYQSSLFTNAIAIHEQQELVNSKKIVFKYPSGAKGLALLRSSLTEWPQRWAKSSPMAVAPRVGEQMLRRTSQSHRETRHGSRKTQHSPLP